MTGLLAIAGVFMTLAASWVRSSTDLAATNRFVGAQQAFYLAEAGLDRKVAQLRDADATNDGVNIPVTTQGPGSFTVTITSLGGGLFELASTGQVGAASKTLRMTVRKGGLPLQVPSATTVVGEGGIGLQLEFVNEGAGTLQINGCDVDSPTCLPGMVVTSDQQFVDVSTLIDTAPYFGDRLVGAQGDAPSSVQLMSGTYSYSAKFQSQNISAGGLGYDMLNSLADYVKAHADPSCSYTIANDNSGSLNSIRLNNRTFGTLLTPKICYVEAPLTTNPNGTYAGGGQQVFLTGSTTGAGLLVIKGGLHIDQGNSLDYNGLLVVVGPEAEMEPYGNLTITGAFLMSTTAPTYPNDSVSPHWNRPEFIPSGAGAILYSSAWVAQAVNLLTDWTPPYGSGGSSSGGSSTSLTIESWQEF